MRFEASLKDLQKAVKDLEKASKKAAKKKAKVTTTNQIDMFAAPAPSNDVNIDALKEQLDVAISSIETLIQESA